MAEAQTAKYQWGQPVTTTVELINDGSYPEIALDALLQNTGATGEIVNVGVIEETGAPIYLVEFADGKVIGVFEDEICPA
jgi:nitrogen fixation protein NifZ